MRIRNSSSYSSESICVICCRTRIFCALYAHRSEDATRRRISSFPREEKVFTITTPISFFFVHSTVRW